MSEHGYSRYSNEGCRCTKCREASAAYRRAHRERFRGQGPPSWVQHGTVNAYVNYLCRCEECRAAACDYQRQYYEQRPC